MTLRRRPFHQAEEGSLVRYWFLSLATIVLSGACSHFKSAAPPPAPRVVRETVTVRDPELDKRLAQLDLLLLARDAQIEDLQSKLDDTRAEVVRAMAKLQTVASRAQAASAMAEAEVSLQSMKSGSSQDPPEAAQVTRLVRQSATEFDKQNYAGALYLANQAKTLASTYRGRLSAGNREGTRPGEIPFAVPIRLKMTTRGNIREGPGTGFPVSFAAEAGTMLTGYSYADEWIRISDETGRSGWIFRSLVGPPD
ncbi:MAG: SH3 domain-containing protein [Gemmatimonadota bacterium]|nr:SH3 domain-containing protein [Gemmatimonadota bacterium]